jgi:uncharacterized protein YdeI (YjbR/CyaY-like superfamily)
MDVTFFESSTDFRRWLVLHHENASSLQVGFYKKGSGKPTITYQEALDEALCFGWIDGVRRGLDADTYTIRFTPRRPNSFWSLVNIRRATELSALGLMQPPGLRAFEERDEDRSERYSYEPGSRSLNPEYERAFQANQPAWTFFQGQAPSYQRAATWWVMSAKRPETRERRLAALIEASAQGRRADALTVSRRQPTPES